jgi:hypothetical protein
MATSFNIVMLLVIWSKIRWLDAHALKEGKKIKQMMKNIYIQDSDVKRHLKVFHFHTSF